MFYTSLHVLRELDIQPSLTPDRNSHGHRLFIAEATKLIDSAQSTIEIENQSFSIREENDEEYERFLKVLLRKQNAGVAIRIIFRDLRESPGNGEEDLKKQLSYLKRFGLNTENMKTQVGCHTKAIIVDAADDNNAAVLFGSHNFTPSGALWNRDASLIVRDGEVARYFLEIFDFDWEVLAQQNVEESIGGIRIATPEEETPAGFRKISFSELMSED